MFGKNWSEFSEGSIEQDHRLGEDPRHMEKSILIPIFKNKGDIMNCGNYRGNVSQHEAI